MKALAGKPSLEVRRRLERTLESAAGKPRSRDSVALSRVIEVLEKMKSAEARRALTQLSKGPAGSRLAREARAALTRLP